MEAVLRMGGPSGVLSRQVGGRIGRSDGTAYMAGCTMVISAWMYWVWKGITNEEKRIDIINPFPEPPTANNFWTSWPSLGKV